MQLDPSTFEVLRNALGSMCDEGSEMIARLAYAPTISEGHDHSCALLTAEGRLSPTATGIRRPTSAPSSLGAGGEGVGGRIRARRHLHLQRPLYRRHSLQRREADPPDPSRRPPSSPSTPAPATGPMWAARCPAASPARGGLLLRRAADAADAALPHGELDRTVMTLIEYNMRTGARAYRRHPRPATGPVR